MYYILTYNEMGKRKEVVTSRMLSFLNSVFFLVHDTVCGKNQHPGE